MTTHSTARPADRKRRHRANGIKTASAIAAGLVLTVAVSSPGDAAPVVIGTGPEAVYVGPAPTFGGDPAQGETEDSYFARTGQHLPGQASVVASDDAWNGAAPDTGGDPAQGETEDSYLARTGHQLPPR